MHKNANNRDCDCGYDHDRACANCSIGIAEPTDTDLSRMWHKFGTVLAVKVKQIKWVRRGCRMRRLNPWEYMMAKSVSVRLDDGRRVSGRVTTRTRNAAKLEECTLKAGQRITIDTSNLEPYKRDVIGFSYSSNCDHSHDPDTIWMPRNFGSVKVI